MLPFVPRKVAKALKSRGPEASTSTPAGSTSSSTQPSVDARSNATNQPETSTNSTNKIAKATLDASSTSLSEEDLVSLLWLALSPHAIWSDPDLRREIEQADKGFIPLMHVVSHSSHFSSTLTEVSIVKALRSHAENAFDIRILVSAPSRTEWYGRETASKASPGSYEIRLRNWKEALDLARSSDRNQWESQMVYVENIPVQHRSVPGIYRFVSALCASSLQPEVLPCVQSIALPRHHLDKPHDKPKCKGFALVTLRDSGSVKDLLNLWPWKRDVAQPTEDISPVIRDALKSGFRTVSKARWTQLNEDYLEYRQRLLAEIAASDRTQPSSAKSNQQFVPQPDAASSDTCLNITKEENGETSSSEASRPSHLQFDRSAPYPPGCLIHARHIHPETNKTTLRKLFARAFPEDGAQVNEGIDYVDFKKGMDTCYLRLATPKHAEQLVSHFSESPIVQSKGLDDEGTPAHTNPITVELVGGTREELYWLKVPEKMRRQAVDKALVETQPVDGQKRKADRDVDTPQEGRAPRRRRKR